MKYRLNSAEKVAVTLYYVPQTKKVNGRNIVTYPPNYMKLVPGEVYETDDEAMLEYFRNHRQKIRHTSAIEETLKANNVPYEIEMCKSCGGRVKKISYQLVEVYDE